MADIIKKVNTLGLVDQYTIAKSLGQEDEFCKSYGIDIEKGGKAAAIGEIREFGGKKYQKQANGWRPVRKGHLSPAQETAVDETQSSTTHIGDMSKEQKYAAAVKTERHLDIIRRALKDPQWRDHKDLKDALKWETYNFGLGKVLTALKLEDIKIPSELLVRSSSPQYSKLADKLVDWLMENHGEHIKNELK